MHSRRNSVRWLNILYCALFFVDSHQAVHIPDPELPAFKQSKRPSSLHLITSHLVSHFSPTDIPYSKSFVHRASN